MPRVDPKPCMWNWKSVGDLASEMSPIFLIDVSLEQNLFKMKITPCIALTQKNITVVCVVYLHYTPEQVFRGLSKRL